MWDSDKDPQGFTTWLDTFSSLVRATDGGAPLEDFITFKTGREVYQDSSVSFFLINDPDFDMPRVTGPGLTKEFDAASTTDTEFDVPMCAQTGSPLQRRVRAKRAELAERLATSPEESIIGMMADVDSLRTGVSKRALLKAPNSYMELSEASRTLDVLLYNVLRMVVKGSKAALLMCVMAPSYVQAVCVLVNHMDISKYDRITRSIFNLDQLTYVGDVHTF